MNAKEIHQELEELFKGLKSGKIKPPQACEMNNAVGKMINLAKLQIEYTRLQRELGPSAPNIPALEGR